jgi:hypothetical protein
LDNKEIESQGLSSRLEVGWLSAVPVAGEVELTVR